MPTLFQANIEFLLYTKRKLSWRLHIFCKKIRLPIVETGCFRAENPGYIIIIYPAFTGFPVAYASFFVFLCPFSSRKAPLAFLCRILAHDMLSVICLTPDPFPEFSDPPDEKRPVPGFGLLPPVSTIRTRRRRPDGSALFRVFGRSRLFNVFPNVSNTDFFGYQRIITDIRLTLFLTHDKVMQTNIHRLKSSSNQFIFSRKEPDSV